MSARVVSRGQPLTLRERQVVERVAAGMTNATIGAELGLSPLTVKQHLQRIAVKAGVGERAGIVGYAIVTGQLNVPVVAAPPREFAGRHFDVLVRIARGHTNERIAAELGVSVDTVRSRVVRVLRLLRVDSREAAVTAGFACGLLRAPVKQRVAA